MYDLISIVYDTDQNAIAAAVSIIMFSGTGMTVRYNQNASFREQESLVKNIELGSLVGNNHDTPRLAVSSRYNLDHIDKENNNSNVNRTSNEDKRAF